MKGFGDCGPTSTQLVLFQAILRRGAEAVEAWQRWMRVADLDRPDAGSSRSLPRLYRTLGREGFRDPFLGKSQRPR